jgi:hypothetical protein
VEEFIETENVYSGRVASPELRGGGGGGGAHERVFLFYSS